MSLYSFFRYLIYSFLFVFIMSSCSGRDDADVKRAVNVLSMVKDMCDKDSFPKNDSILNFSVKVFSRVSRSRCFRARRWIHVLLLLIFIRPEFSIRIFIF